MVKEPVHLSDWIEFLNRKIDRNNTISVAFIAVLIALITLFIAVWSFQGSVLSTEIEIINLSHSTNTSIDIRNITNFIYWLDVLKYTILGVIVFQIGITFYIPNLSYVKKARRILNEIMQNPNEIEVDGIRKEWFRKDKNMNQFTREFRKLDFLSKLGFFLILFSFALILLSIFGLSFGIDFRDTGIWILPIGLALYAIGLAVKSDEKMQSLTELNFIEKNAMMHGYMGNNAKKIIRDIQATFKVIDWIEISKDTQMKENFINDFILFTDMLINNGIIGTFEDSEKTNYRNLINEARRFNFQIERLDDLLKRI